MEKVDSQPHIKLILTTMLLVVTGLIFIYSSSSIAAYQNYGDAFHYVKKQCLGLTIGTVLGLLIFKMKEDNLSRLTLPILAFSFLFLVFTLIPSLQVRVNGAARWVSFFGIGFQPAELIKLSCVFFLAKNLSRTRFRIDNFWAGIVPVFGFFSVHSIILLFQPDLGTAVLLFLVTVSMLYIANLKAKYFVAIGITGVIGLTAAIFQAPYRLARLVSFIDPWQDSKNSGFQIIQSYLGYKNGGLTGLGIGESKQKLYFLPEAHTDFILSVIGEELGLLGIFLLIFTFSYLIYQGFIITKNQTEAFKQYLSFGLVCLISYQTFINFGVSMGILPTKGISLPFISSGSSSLVSFLVAIAILAKLSINSVPQHSLDKI